LRTFARTVRAGEWLDVRVDTAQPERQPLPRSDLRQRHVPLGPVAVFGASNFPLAFSVAGGDTASALAAGCPVIVKAHGAHPGTSELVGRAVARAVQQCGLPEGVFSLVPELAAKSMPCGTQVITTAPLGDELAKTLLPQDYCVEDCNYLLDYYRLTSDKRLIFGGGVVYGARDPANIEAIIRPKMLKAFPQLKDVKIDYAWTGNFLLTLSRLPQVGRLGDNIYYSQGCSGHGVTYTHLAGKVLAEALRGQAERFDAFAGLPHYPFPGGQLLRTPFAALGAWYYGLRDKLGF
jgi:gamma-glutamylputrescine oxidase